MSRICDLCEKSAQKGNSVKRGIGDRVTNRAIKRQQPNLRTKRIIVDGTKVTLTLCASCLKRLKFEQKQLAKQAEAANSVAVEA